MYVDIQAVHRILRRSANQDKPNPILIQFTNRRKKDAILEKSKHNKITAADIVDNIPNTPIYVNEHLTPYYKNILYEAKAKKARKEIEYV